MKTVRGVCVVGLAMLGTWSTACSGHVIVTGHDGGGTESGGSAGSAGKGGSSAGGASGNAGDGGAPGQGTGGMGGGVGGARDAGSAEPDSGQPTVKITAPADLSTIGPGAAAPDYPKVKISFRVGHFALMVAGTPVKTCPLGSCGHVHLNVDGKDCNDLAKGAPYNVQGIASPLDADLSLCMHGVGGAHTVTLSLHNTDHSVVENAAGDTIQDTITIAAASDATEGGTPEAGGANPDAGDGG